MDTPTTQQTTSRLTTKLMILTKYEKPPTQTDVDRPYSVAIHELEPQYELPFPMNNRAIIKNWDSTGKIYKISEKVQEKIVLAATTQDEQSLMEFYDQISTDYHGGRMFMTSNGHQCLGTFLKEQDAKRLEDLMRELGDKSLTSE